MTCKWNWASAGEQDLSSLYHLPVPLLPIDLQAMIPNPTAKTEAQQQETSQVACWDHLVLVNQCSSKKVKLKVYEAFLLEIIWHSPSFCYGSPQYPVQVLGAESAFNKYLLNDTIELNTSQLPCPLGKFLISLLNYKIFKDNYLDRFICVSPSS